MSVILWSTDELAHVVLAAENLNPSAFGREEGPVYLRLAESLEAVHRANREHFLDYYHARVTEDEAPEITARDIVSALPALRGVYRSEALQSRQEHIKRGLRVAGLLRYNLAEEPPSKALEGLVHVLTVFVPRAE